MMMSASADPSQRRLMLIFPLFFVIILYRYPAGLLLYWITTNLWTIGQSYFVRRTIGSPPPVARGAPSTGGRDGPGQADNGKPAARAPAGAPALAGAGGASGGTSGASGRAGGSPPPPPRKKKKRSGRRR
jgi:YidC/Oxa1 family membrane protein insertase